MFRGIHFCAASWNMRNYFVSEAKKTYHVLILVAYLSLLE